MTTATPGVAHDTPAGDLSANRASFLRALRAANLSPLTLRTYADAVDRLADYLAAHVHGSRCLVDYPGWVLARSPAGRHLPVSLSATSLAGSWWRGLPVPGGLPPEA